MEQFPDKDLNAHLNNSEKAIAKGMRSIVEDNFYFVFGCRRWATKENIDHLFENVFAPFPLPKFVLPLVKMKIKCDGATQTKAQGIGRHTNEELLELGKKDTKAISDFLENKPFLMGEKISEVDCTVFAFLVCLFYSTPEKDLLRMYVENELPNLRKYVDRLKNQYWPDWEECRYQEKKK